MSGGEGNNLVLLANFQGENILAKLPALIRRLGKKGLIIASPTSHDKILSLHDFKKFGGLIWVDAAEVEIDEVGEELHGGLVLD